MGYQSSLNFETVGTVPKSGYQPTSRDAYYSNLSDKARQAKVIYELIVRLKETTLRELSDKTGLPQSTVSGRYSDLKVSGKVKEENKLTYKGRTRIRIVPV